MRIGTKWDSGIFGDGIVYKFLSYLTDKTEEKASDYPQNNHGNSHLFAITIKMINLVLISILIPRNTWTPSYSTPSNVND